MASKQKLQLRKDLERFHGAARSWSRQDLTSGKWFGQFLERQLASHLGGRTPPELEAAFPDADDADERADEVTTQAIHRAIAATDAYLENLTGTEMRALKEKRLDGAPTKLTGDSVALIAELCFVMDCYLTLMFDVTACFKKVFAGGEIEVVAEIFGRSLGHFDVDEARKAGGFIETVGAKIYDRAIVQTVENKVADALRKGFYCYLGKAVGKTVPDYIERFEDWVAPQAVTGPMLTVDPDAVDDGLGFET